MPSIEDVMILTVVVIHVLILVVNGDGGCGGDIGDNIGSGSSSGSNMVVVAAVDWWYRI